MAQKILELARAPGKERWLSLTLAFLAVQSAAMSGLSTNFLKEFIADIFAEIEGGDHRSRKLLALLLCETGNLSDAISRESRVKFCTVIQEAIFRAARAHAEIVWAPDNGETMAAFLAYANMRPLAQMTNLLHLPPWRVPERFVIQGASQHGDPTLLVYNQHQPSSKQRPLPSSFLQSCSDECDTLLSNH